MGNEPWEVEGGGLCGSMQRINCSGTAGLEAQTSGESHKEQDVDLQPMLNVLCIHRDSCGLLIS